MRLANSIFNSFSNPPMWLTRWIHGWDWGDGREDQKVTPRKALTYAPIWYGVNKISGHIGQLPICVYKRLDRGAERDRKHNVAKLIRRPNEYQTSIVFREQIATHSLLYGNGRAAIVKQSGKPVELIPLIPENTHTLMQYGMKMHATRPSKDDRLRLFFKPAEWDNGEEGLIILNDSDVIHIPGLSLDGVVGVSLIDIASRNIGASINAERRLANQMENGFTGNLMLEAPPGVFRNETDAKLFIDEFERRHNAPDKAGKPGLLREGIKANILAMNNKDAEMIDNRKFQRQDAALYLGLESILGDDASVSYNSLEQKNLAYLQNCLNRWLKRWEEEMEWKLLPRRQFDMESHYIRFNTAALLKSDYKTSIESLSLAIGATIMSPNEAREKLDMNPYPGGDIYQNPAITPGESATEVDDQPEEAKEENDNQMRLALNNHIGHLIGVEANRIKQGSRQAKNFIEWVDNFYSKHFERSLADNLENLGLDRNEATLHCDESKRLLTEVLIHSTPDTLVESVAKCVSTWKARASSIGVLENV